MLLKKLYISQLDELIILNIFIFIQNNYRQKVLLISGFKKKLFDELNGKI